MTVPNLPAVHHITVDGEDHLATHDGYRWQQVGDGDSWAVGSKLVTRHGEVIPAGPVENLVRLPDVGEMVRNNLCWRAGGLSTGISAGITADNARANARIALKDAAQYLAVARAIDAEQAKPLTARERLLVRLHDRQGDGHEYLEWPVGDLLDALGEQP